MLSNRYKMWKITKYVRMILSCQLILANSRTTGQLHEKYVGCFADNGDNQKVELALINQSNLTIEICIQKCYNKSNETKSETTFAGLYNGSRCVCRNDSGQQLPDLNCNVQCSGDPQQTCGGNVADRIYSLYTVCPVGYFGLDCDQLCHCKRHLPCDRITGICPNGCDEQWKGTSCNISNVRKQYIGCYGDGSVHQQRQAMDVLNPGRKTGSGTKTTNSIDFCIKICSSNNNTYAGMQYGYDCNCGEKYNRYGNKTHSGQQVSCSFPCPANENQKCGGNFANSVYYVCPVGFYGLNCVSRCQCNGGPCRFNGSCLTSTLSPCKPRWTGSACSIRGNDILWCSSDSDCKPNEACNLINLIYTNVSRCRCKQGFHRMNIWANCTDVDECQSRTSNCNLNSENCFNTIGNYRCECKDGFENLSGRCEDIDECGDESHRCETETELCKNTIGGHYCDCKPGYGNTSFGNCTDVDECKPGNSTCDINLENCFNTIGNYRCDCKDGFANISGNCDDIDECGSESHRCVTETELCKNIIGGYFCDCKPGYEKTTFGNCTDVDECPSSNSTCNPNSENCLNTIGNYICECKDGFVNISGKCDDVDECKSESNQCEAKSELCNNTIGSYTCFCKTGYENTTFGTCTDVDECQLHWPSSPCDSYSERCINAIGNYICICKENFTVILGKCVDLSGMATTGIILGIFLAISLLVNMILIVSRVSSAKSRKPGKESREDMAQSNFESSSLNILDHPEVKYDEIPNRLGQNSMYEEIITGQRQLVLNETSDYAELRQNSYVNVAPSTCMLDD